MPKIQFETVYHLQSLTRHNPDRKPPKLARAIGLGIFDESQNLQLLVSQMPSLWSLWHTMQIAARQLKSASLFCWMVPFASFELLACDKHTPPI